MLRVSDIMITGSLQGDEDALDRGQTSAATGSEGQMRDLSRSDFWDQPAWSHDQAEHPNVNALEVAVIDVDEPAVHAAKMMAEKNLRRLVVMNADGKVVGMVSPMDVVRAFAADEGIVLGPRLPRSGFERAA